MTDATELDGELEMLQACYAESEITRTTVDQLGSGSGSRQTSTLLLTTATMGSPSASSESVATISSPEANERVVIAVTFHGRVEIEITVPAQGYFCARASSLPAPRSLSSAAGAGAGGSSSPTKPRVRLDVVRSPISVDSELLLQEMKKVVRESTADAGGLLISICQAAEAFVEAALHANLSSSSSGSHRGENDNNNDNEDLDDDNDAVSMAATESGMSMAATASSAMRAVNSYSAIAAQALSSASSVSGGRITDDVIQAELARRGAVRLSPEKVIVDQKSKFLAHAAPVRSEAEAMEAVALVREIKACSVACHPAIWAYRYTSSTSPGSSSKTMAYDCDDDGEKNGSRNILFVMEQLHVDGWIVVVTRWYGGHLLGPTRFKHIASVTRSVLDEAGAANPSSAAAATTGKK